MNSKLQWSQTETLDLKDKEHKMKNTSIEKSLQMI